MLERVSLGHGATSVLVEVDATFGAGRCTAVVGPSGAGKTTLLRLLNRFEEPDSGRVLLDRTPVGELDVLSLRRRVGLVPQRPVLLTDTVGEEVQVGRSLGAERVDELLAAVGLADGFAARRCAELSGGEAQRVCLARALAVEPEVMLLDEPTSALDGTSAVAIRELIRAHVGAGGSVVLVSHDPGFVAEVADEVWTLAGGRLTRGAEAGNQE
ncbi:Iron-chelate-transporting ATPase [Nocardia seriolae]|nr:Iron-chelate-transporting ATPase [Nocardia seriolae]MTJ63735.1 ATP-binding cassette domain-containing protein [Nocardia seriolae]MTJ75542.1 ATP-binding cassette domain-containing protein [Nocardia seriolae]MTJ88302.1 ATP-binding cassette domain-containing protein [Nocardia seriolae]MTK41625.1 ATP-binding cassette domain-containing protein [Nocardia seriolae]